MNRQIFVFQGEKKILESFVVDGHDWNLWGCNINEKLKRLAEYGAFDWINGPVYIVIETDQDWDIEHIKRQIKSKFALLAGVFTTRILRHFLAAFEPPRKNTD